MTDPILVVGVAVVAALVAALVCCGLALGYCQARIVRPLREMERRQTTTLAEIITIGGRVERIHEATRGRGETPDAPGVPGGDGGMIGG